MNLFDLIELIIKNFAPYFSQIWDSIVFWRGLALVLLLIMSTAFIYRRKIVDLMERQANVDHDRNVFNAANELLKERDLNRFLERLGADHSYDRDLLRQICRFFEFFGEVGNGFIDSQIQRRIRELIICWNKLDTFIALNFWVYPRNQIGEKTRLCMHPELNMDREGSGSSEEFHKYAEYTKCLDEYIKLVEEKFSQYRKFVMHRLKI